MLISLKFLFQYLLSQQWITYLVGWFSNQRAGFLTKLMIKLFIKYYQVNMEEAKKSDIANYHTFNDFFVRELRENARPIDENPNVLVMPADGTISQFGKIEDNKILQAKGHKYTLEALLAGNHMVEQFRNGTFVTIYLSPRDYHRVHMPYDAILREVIYVPGSLFSINHFSTHNISNLFARNERLICLFDTIFGPIAQILVGARIVSSIETIWTSIVTLPREGVIKRWTWPVVGEDSINILKGQEMGRFNLGSTVINLFTQGKIQLVQKLEIMSATKIGQPLAFCR